MRAVWEAGDGGLGGKELQPCRQPVRLGVSAVVLGSQPAEPVGYLSTGLILTESRSLITAALGYSWAGRDPTCACPWSEGLVCSQVSDHPVCLVLGLFQKEFRGATKSFCRVSLPPSQSKYTNCLPFVLELLSIAPGPLKRPGQLQSSSVGSNASYCASGACLCLALCPP